VREKSSVLLERSNENMGPVKRKGKGTGRSRQEQLRSEPSAESDLFSILEGGGETITSERINRVIEMRWNTRGWGTPGKRNTQEVAEEKLWPYPSIGEFIKIVGFDPVLGERKNCDPGNSTRIANYLSIIPSNVEMKEKGFEVRERRKVMITPT